MARLNCWQNTHCGREPGGHREHELGVCRTATATYADGINGGIAGGRICWAISGSLCGGIVQGHFAEKRATCLSCDFFEQVRIEERGKFRVMLPASAAASEAAPTSQSAL